MPGSRLHWRRVLLEGAGAASEGELSRFLAQFSAAGAGDEPPLPAGKRPARTLNLVRVLAAERHAAVAERVRTAAEGWAALRGRGYDDAELERLARLQRRAAAARAGMREFLTAAALQSETDRYDERADRVALMSLHAAKGLEFPVVFIVGCEEGLLPYRPPHRAADPIDPAEERRLFYVGMTRARHRLILTHASRRLLFGQRLENRISRFVTDIETALREAGQAPRRPTRPNPKTCSCRCSDRRWKAAAQRARCNKRRRVTIPPPRGRITVGSGSVEGVYVSAELIGIIAAAIAVGTAILASMRSIRQELRNEIGSVRNDIGSVRNEIGSVRSEIGSQIDSVRSEIRNEIRNEIGSVHREIADVRSELRDTRSELRDEMQTGFKELTSRMINIGDRLSKVEGIIEGMFWGARNQPPEKPREGAA